MKIKQLKDSDGNIEWRINGEIVQSLSDVDNIMMETNDTYEMKLGANTDEGGTKHDSDKPRYDLIPWDALNEVVLVLTEGAKKYDDRNWEKGIKYGRLFSAMQRHLSAFWRGDRINKEDFNLHHLAHAVCCGLMMLAEDIRGMDHMDDRPSSETGGDRESKET